MHGFITTGNEKLANKRMQRMVNVSIIPEQFMHFYDSQKAFSNLCVILSVYKKNNNINFHTRKRDNMSDSLFL